MVTVMQAPLKSDSRLSYRTNEDKAYYFWNTLVQNWDPTELQRHVVVKMLFLNAENKPVGMCEYGDIDNIDPNPGLLEAHHNAAKSVVVGLNDPSEEFTPDAKTHELLRLFKEASKSHNIRLGDFLLLSKWGYNSFLENHRL